MLHWNFWIRWERRYKGMESLNLKKLLDEFLDWKIFFILHCSNELLTNLYKRCLKFRENVPKYGRTTNNTLSGTVGTICLGTYNLFKIFFLILDQLYLLGSCYIWKYFSGVLLLYQNFPCWQILKKRNRSVWTKAIL